MGSQPIIGREGRAPRDVSGELHPVWRAHRRRQMWVLACLIASAAVVAMGDVRWGRRDAGWLGVTTLLMLGLRLEDVVRFRCPDCRGALAWRTILRPGFCERCAAALSP